MMFSKKKLWLELAVLFCIFMIAPAHADTSMSRRVAMETQIHASVVKDLSLPEQQVQELENRVCLDGRPVKGFQGDLVEYWVNLECSFCGIQEPLQAQRNDSGLCIVVRHVPSQSYGESLKKALSYEALKKFSVNAANLFWEKVLPKTALPLPVPYEASLLAAFQEAALSPEAFSDALTNEATTLVEQDTLASMGRITSTPTYVLQGIRFGSCDFTASELPTALTLAKKARSGDEEAKKQIITVITNGHMNEKIL